MHTRQDEYTPAGRLLERIRGTLGLPGDLLPDLDGLKRFYGAWCRSVPFENTRKMIALRSGRRQPLPGGHAVDFLENWLEHGAGGTCWPSSNALFSVALALGFDAARVVASMRDLGTANHASVEIRIDGRRWLADSSMLTNVPLPLGNQIFTHDDPVFPVEVEPVGGSHLVWTHTPPNSAYIPCRLMPGPVGHSLYLDSYEASRDRSPFNQRLYARRNSSDELVVLAGCTRFCRTGNGVESLDLSREELCSALHEEIGLSRELIEDWGRCGALDASFEPPAGPRPPPASGKPPSKR